MLEAMFAHSTDLPLLRLPALLPTPATAQLGTGWAVWMIQHCVQRLDVSDIRTELCCETTARHRIDLDLGVDDVTDTP